MTTELIAHVLRFAARRAARCTARNYSRGQFQISLAASAGLQLALEVTLPKDDDLSGRMSSVAYD